MSAKDDLAHPSSGPASSGSTVSHLLTDAAELEELPEVLATGHRVDFLEQARMHAPSGHHNDADAELVS